MDNGFEAIAFSTEASLPVLLHTHRVPSFPLHYFTLESNHTASLAMVIVPHSDLLLMYIQNCVILTSCLTEGLQMMLGCSGALVESTADLDYSSHPPLA